MFLAGWTLGGGLASAAIFFGVVAFAARELVPSPLGPANRLTIARLAVLGALAGLSFPFSAEAPLALSGWIPCLSYGAASLADFADGVLARHTRSESAFGARLDAEADALGIAAASGIGVFVAGTLPRWYLAAGLARYLFGAGLFIERHLGRRPQKLSPSPFRRRLAGFQMGLLVVCLAPGIELRWALPSSVALGAPFLAGFVHDYLLASGRLGQGLRQFAFRLDRLRAPASRIAAFLAAALGALKLAGLPTGSLALAAFFFAWLMRPPR